MLFCQIYYNCCQNNAHFCAKIFEPLSRRLWFRIIFMRNGIYKGKVFSLSEYHAF